MAVDPSDNSKAGGDQQGAGHTNLWARIREPRTSGETMEASAHSSDPPSTAEGKGRSSAQLHTDAGSAFNKGRLDELNHLN